MSDLPLIITLGPQASAPWQTFTSNWFGQPPKHQASFQVCLDDDRFHYAFKASKPAQADLQLKAGSFREGLWHQDVAEIFLMGPCGNYVEFNLSPSGAWWSAHFSSYRTDPRPLPLLQIQATGHPFADHWQANLSLSRAQLTEETQIDLRSARFNVTAILDPDNPDYLCWAHQLGGNPDFHRESHFTVPQWSS